MNQADTAVLEFGCCITSVVKDTDRCPAMLYIGKNTVPCTALSQGTLGCKGNRCQSMDHMVAVQRPLRRKCSIIIIQSQIQNIPHKRLLLQAVCHHADDFPPCFQTCSLRSLIRAPGISGYQHIALLCNLTACFLRKGMVFHIQITTADYRNGRFSQQGNISLCPQNTGTVQPHAVADWYRIQWIEPCDGITIKTFRPAEVFPKLPGSGKQRKNMLCHTGMITQSRQIRRGQIPGFFLPIACLHPLGKFPKLGNCERFSARIPKVACQQEKPLLRAGQRKRFLMTGAFTSSSVKLPSSPRSMGRMV